MASTTASTRRAPAGSDSSASSSNQLRTTSSSRPAQLIPWKGSARRLGRSGAGKIGGVETVIGVNSFGILLCLFEASSTRVDTYKSFVEKYL